MKLAVLGASGPTGRQVVDQALGHGDVLTAFVRDPARLALSHPRLRLVVGDATRDEAALAEAVHGQDAVICALGRRTTLRSERLMERSTRLLLPAMARAGVRRLVWMSSLGVGESRLQAPLVPRLMYRVLLADIFADKLVAEEQVRASALEWTITHPVMLTDGPLTGSYRAAERLELRGLPRISRADVAHFMLAEVGGRRFLRKTVVLAD